MGKPIVHEYGQEKTILKFFPYKGAACLVPQTMGVVADGKKIVKAGTPFPSNDGNCVGFILADVDVTQGDEAGTYVYAGVLDPDKLAENGIEIANAAQKAVPRVTIYGTPYTITASTLPVV